MFDWIVTHFGFLKHVPLLPHVFDAWLKLVSLFTNKNLSDYIDDIEAEVLSWQHTDVSAHKYGGVQFNAFNRELGLVLMNRYPIQHHHVFKHSGWVSFKIKTVSDKKLAIELLRAAYIQNNS